MTDYRIKIYILNKKLHWTKAFANGREALHAAFDVLEKHIDETAGMKFGLSIFPVLPQQQEAA